MNTALRWRLGQYILREPEGVGTGGNLDSPNAFDVPTFCKRNNISTTSTYKAVRQDRGDGRGRGQIPQAAPRGEAATAKSQAAGEEAEGGQH